MGFPVSPELARMCTAFLLRNYQPPRNESLTLYSDDVYATYPHRHTPPWPIQLKRNHPKHNTKLCIDPDIRTFKPLQQKFRQPVLLHLQRTWRKTLSSLQLSEPR